MYKRILVPLDGSAVAEEILSAVTFLANGLHARVQILSVIEEDVVAAIQNPLQGRFLEQTQSTATGVAEAYGKRVAAKLGLPAGQVDVTVKVSSVPETILREAERAPDTLLAMSTHGRSGLQRFVLGSVADKLLHATKAPLLLYRPSEKAPAKAASLMTTVIVPLDGSALAEKVLPDVVSLAQTLSLKVLLTRVTSLMTEYYAGEGFYAVPQSIVTDLEQEAIAYLNAKAADLKKMGCKDVAVQHMQGSAAAQVIDLAHATPDSFVAISTHGRSGIGRWVLGSVADRVIQQAGCPVLVIR
ncbi:MAG: universal stress protein [Dehalococcoidia bacterium]|nr:universal stress protein [Dehalococcoidia bacterium]